MLVTYTVYVMSSDRTESQGRRSTDRDSSQQGTLYSKPTIKVLLNSKIISAIGPKWYELGILLLDDDQLRQLKVIETNNSEVTRRCTEMLMYWLESHSRATWHDLVEALKAPGVELNNVATMVEEIFVASKRAHPLEEELEVPNLKRTRLESPDVRATPKLKDEDPSDIFTKFHTVSEAFVFLTSKLKLLLSKTDFSNIQRSCIEQINTPNGAQLPPDLVARIKSCETITELFEVLAESPYWSWIDVRLLQVMAAASGLVEAIKLLSSYRNVIFSKRLIDLLPNAPTKEVKEAYYTKLVTKVKKNPDEMTVADLLDFKAQLEKVLLDIKEGVCILEHIEDGCIEVHWYIPTNCVNNAYQTAKVRSYKFSDLYLQYLKIGLYPVIFDPLDSPDIFTTIPSPPIDVATVRDFINHYYDYLSINMDAEVVTQLMVSQQLFSENVVKYSISNFQKNSLILQQVAMMSEQKLLSFAQLLLTSDSQNHIGTMLIDGLHVSLMGKKSIIPSVVYQADVTAEQMAHEEQEMHATDNDMIHPSLMIGEFLNLKIQLEELVQQCDPMPIIEKCGSLLASDTHNIPLFPIGYTEELQDIKHTPELIQKLNPFMTWDNHSILTALAEASDIPEAIALLTQFDDKIVSSQLLTSFPVPAPSHHMAPYDNSTHTVLAVKLDSELCRATLQNVIDARSLIQDQCKLTSHCLLLLAVAKTNHTIIYWMIPKSITHLITANALQFQSYFHQNGILQLAVYPGALLSTESALKVGPLSFLNQISANSSLQTDDLNTHLSQIEELPQIVSKLQKEMNNAISTVARMTKLEDKTGDHKVYVSQLNIELSEMSSRLMIKEKELAKLKEDNKRLVKQIRGRKNRRGETISQLQDQPIQQELLGSGRYGEVYKFSYSDKLYAGKIIYKKLLLGHSTDEISKFMDKIENVSATFDINPHPNIEQFHSVVQLSTDGPLIVLTELLPENLNSYIARMKDKLPINKQFDLCHDIAKGLRFLHNAGIIHSNLHGANILISEDGHAKVTDYICPQIASLNESTVSENKVYMSPESIKDKKLVSKESDIYSLGVLCLQVATQSAPMPNDSTELLEVQRWKEQLDHITKNPLRPLILQCLKVSIARPNINRFCNKIATVKENFHSVISNIEGQPVATPLFKEMTFDQLQLHESGTMIGFLQCMIIQSYGGMYDDTVRAIPMEMPSQVLTNEGNYSVALYERETIEDIESYIKRDELKELSFSLYDAPNAQKSKQSYLECIEILFKECTKNGVMIYYTGYGEEGTGNWCFKDGTISFRDIFTLYKKYLKEKLLVIYSDCCYSGQWVVDCAKCLDEMGIGACGHQAIKHGILLKMSASCQPNQRATLGSFVAQKGIFFNEDDKGIHFFVSKKLSDTQTSYGVDFTKICCLQLEGPTAACRLPDVPAKCSWKWEDVIALPSKERPSALIYLVRGKDREIPVWRYVLVERELEEDFHKQVATGTVDAANFGYVFKSGLGEDPPDDTQKAVKKYCPN